MTRLVVHMGAAKTATTYIQHALYVNTDVMREHGVYLPTSGRLSEFGGRSVAHHNLAWELTKDERFRPRAGRWSDLAAEIRDMEAPVVLLSCEGFERISRNPTLRDVLGDELRRLSDDVRIVYVVRDQLSQINSLYAQAVKQFAPPQPFRDRALRALRDDRFDLEQCFSVWYSDNAFEFAAVPFTDLVDGDPLVNFLEAAGISVPQDSLSLQDKDANTSLGPVGIEAVKLLAHHLRVLDPGFSPRSNAARELYRLASSRARNNGWCEQKFWGWEPDDAARVAARLADSNRRFAHAVWGTDWPMPLPIDKPRTAVDLVDLPLEQVAHVERYVNALGRRYVEMRTGLRKTRNPQEGDAPGSDASESDSEAAADELESVDSSSG